MFHKFSHNQRSALPMPEIPFYFMLSTRGELSELVGLTELK